MVLFGCGNQKQTKSLPLPEYGLLWQIKGNGLSEPSYLFGTAHVPEAIQIIDSIPEFKLAFSSAHQFICECLPDSSINIDQFSLKEIDKKMTFLKPWPVKDSGYSVLLTHTQKCILDSVCKKDSSFRLIEWANLRPLTAINYVKIRKRMKRKSRKNIGIKGTDKQHGDFSKKLILDYHLLKQAQLHNKKTLGLETYMERQINHDSIISKISLLSYREEMDIFIFYLQYHTKLDSINDEYKNKILSQYLNQEINRMSISRNNLDVPDSYLSLINKLRKDDLSEIRKKFMIDNRNKKWMERIPEFIKNESSFIAVGAAHLGGENGLVNLLRELNYEVIPIKEARIEP